MIRISVNLDILSLSMVMITTRKIVQDVLRSLSSFKGSGSLPHLSFFHNLSLLNNRPTWSFMTNLLLPPLCISLCVLVILPRTMLKSPLEPKIFLLQRRKLRVYHLRWFNHLPMVLFISNDWVSIQFFSLL
jgi:hypothetical protein